MKLSESFFYTLRENSKDEDSVSGNLLVRAGMIKKSSNGMYMIMPMGKRVLSRIENIVREEMDAKGAQELLMPALIPEDVYVQSGRRSAFGSNMFTLLDRYNKKYVLGPTHEELFAIAASMDGKSYKDFPYNLYQIQTKFRDETRPRYGLIRVREFIMKDAYTFDIDEAGLDTQYDKMYDAYCRIFDRFDLTYKIVRADTGAMGGLLSEEYQAITNIGEDIVVGCEGCDFSSNLEITEVMDTKEASTEEKKEMELVETPNAKTIEEVAAFFGKQPEDFVKTLLYNVDGNIVAFCIPGDRELNETKALKALGAAEMELADFADVEKATGAKVGFAGPVGLNVPVYMDRQIEKMRNFIVGANKTDHHYANVNVDDFTPKAVLDLCQVKEGDICPKCGAKLTFDHGIEVGNLFKLGTKYAKSMNLLYTDANNEQQPVWMGSYGIGLERCMAAIVEQHHDDQGIIWPLEVAPFKACIVPVQVKDETQLGCANDLYAYCLENKYDVLLDDRKERAGVKFKDMELIGVPYRITVGRGAKDGLVEWVERAKEGKEEISIEEAKSRLDAIYRQ
ncbi:proline--tRNA ligase [uncultured Dubosiella sp.]|uniref:proline--tRNA ligase n=3 Tax=uncultured Dubosiella sp. TaxID=1937011 RepID=UPI0025B58256|nr:proline--tRNA ligase [uncultured Dubosiella sp.]